MDVLLDGDEVRDDDLDFAGVHVLAVYAELVYDSLQIVSRLQDVLLDAFHDQWTLLVQRIGIVVDESLVIVSSNLVHVFDVVARLESPTCFSETRRPLASGRLQERISWLL